MQTTSYPIFSVSMHQIIVLCLVSITVDIFFIWKSLRLEQLVDGIKFETTDALAYPIFKNVEHFLVNDMVAIIQVGLLWRELVKITFTPAFVISPRRRVVHRYLINGNFYHSDTLNQTFVLNCIASLPSYWEVFSFRLQVDIPARRRSS